MGLTLQQKVDGIMPPQVTFTPIQSGSGSPEDMVESDDFRSVRTYTVTGASSWTDYAFSAVGCAEITNLTPQTLELDGSFLKRISGNGGEILATDCLGFKWPFAVSFGYSSSGGYKLFRGWVPGSTPAKSWGHLEPLLNAAKPLALFSSFDHTAGSYTKDPNCWASGLDFSGVTVWNSRSKDFRQTFTAFTRRHLWGAWHYRLQVGDQVRFRRSDGVIETYTVIGINPGNDFSTSIPLHEVVAVGDICVALLDRELHPLISNYAIAEWAIDVISLRNTPAAPVIPTYGMGIWTPSETQVHSSAAFVHLNHQREALIRLVGGLAVGSAMTADETEYYGETIPYHVEGMNFANGIYSRTPPYDFSDSYARWIKPVVAGTSGCPLFCCTGTGSGLALASTFTSPDWGMAPHVGTLNAILRATDAAAGVSTGLSATAAPLPI